MGLYKAKPRLLDLYAEDPALLVNLSIPEGLESQTANAIIIQECGELQTVFEDAASLKAYLAPWSAAHAVPWTRMLAALTAEYNPIHNYDRTDTETITDTETGTSETNDTEATTESGTSTVSGTGSESETGSESGTGSASATGSETGSGSATTEVTKGDTSTIKKMGFNSATFVDSDQTTVEATENGENTTSTSTSTSTETESENAISTSRNVDSETSSTGATSKTGSKTGHGTAETSRDAERERVLTSQGNIGVTTAQQMITAEIEMRSAFNMYKIIATAFRQDLCVGVW